MKTKIKFTWLIVAFSLLSFAGCEKEGPPGPAGEDGQDATVYYSEWFSPAEWSGESGDWYFTASAPDLTKDVVEGGVILAYAWLAGDLYESSSVRPLPAYAVGANWSFLVHEYGYIEFTCDMVDVPAATDNYFRFVAIPGTIPALKSASAAQFKKQLREWSYKRICEEYNIPE